MIEGLLGSSKTKCKHNEDEAVKTREVSTLKSVTPRKVFPFCVRTRKRGSKKKAFGKSFVIILLECVRNYTTNHAERMPNIQERSVQREEVTYVLLRWCSSSSLFKVAYTLAFLVCTWVHHNLYTISFLTTSFLRQEDNLTPGMMSWWRRVFGKHECLLNKWVLRMKSITANRQLVKVAKYSLVRTIFLNLQREARMWTRDLLWLRRQLHCMPA